MELRELSKLSEDYLHSRDAYKVWIDICLESKYVGKKGRKNHEASGMSNSREKYGQSKFLIRSNEKHLLGLFQRTRLDHLANHSQTTLI